MKRITRVHVERVLASSNGKFFGVTFKKKDDTLRTMNARFGVKKHLKGGSNNVVKDDNAYVTAWDRTKGAYRTINLDTIEKLSVNGEKFEVV